MPIIPFSFQCTFHEYHLLVAKDSEKGFMNMALDSKIPDFFYNLTIYPNGDNDARRGQTLVYLRLKLEKVKLVEADFSVSIESANYFYETQKTFEKAAGWIYYVADTEDFFNPANKFIVDRKCNIKVKGTFQFENDHISNLKQQKWESGELGNELWEERDDKNFTIFVDGKEIKVHKLVLRIQSDVFKAMFKPETKESIENKVEIPDFSFTVVETAVKIIYNCNFTSALSLDETMSLLQFFDKYQISSLKEKVELYLMNQISAATVCRLTNCSIFTNSINLKKKCLKFLKESFASKIPLSDIDSLDKDIFDEVFQNSFYDIVKIR